MPEADAETMLIEDMAAFHDNPLGFVLYAFDWSAGEGPDEWQRQTLESVGQAVREGRDTIREAVSSGHGIGKSALVAWIILWAMSTRPHLAGVVTANTGRQLKDKTWRELAIWHKKAINAHWFAITATKFYQVDHPDTWFVAATPWSKENAEAFAGLHAKDVLMIFDEASAIPDIIWETAEGAMTTAGAMWLAFGNPTKNTGKFRECFGRFRNRWITRSVDSRTAKMANPKQIQQWLEDYGEDSDFFKVRVRGVFPSAAFNQLIPLDVVEAAMARALAPGSVDGAARIWGFDIARYGDDASVCFERQGRAAKLQFVTRKLDLMTLANRMAHEWRTHNPDAVFIDDGGVGGGVTDRLRELGFKPIAVQFQAQARDAANYANIRAQMWFEMAEWLKIASIPEDPRLRDDLISPEYAFDGQGRRILESKDDMKKRGFASPDLGDALALTFAVPVGRPRPATASPAPYNPYDWMERR